MYTYIYTYHICIYIHVYVYTYMYVYLCIRMYFRPEAGDTYAPGGPAPAEPLPSFGSLGGAGEDRLLAGIDLTTCRSDL